MKGKRILALGLCLALATPAFATEPETVPETLPPIYVGVQELDALPGSWDPLEDRTPDREAILRLTAEPLFRLAAEGTVEPAQAASLPRDVTAEFAGRYGVPGDAQRGYAFAISLREGACWENGTPVTTADWAYTFEKMLDSGSFPLEIANYGAFLRGDTHPAAKIQSLQDAGYSTVTEAISAGYRDFYVDTTWYWGLDTGWLRTTDRTRLFDAAIPSGCEEMYVTPAYLYRTYLADGGKEAAFQGEFVGIPVENGEPLTREDVGLVAESGRVVLILQEPAAASTVALALTGLYPVPAGSGENYGTPRNYTACGPYRIAEASDAELLLEPNPHWNGEAGEFERIRCTAGA